MASKKQKKVREERKEGYVARDLDKKIREKIKF